MYRLSLCLLQADTSPSHFLFWSGHFNNEAKTSTGVHPVLLLPVAHLASTSCVSLSQTAVQPHMGVSPETSPRVLQRGGSL